MQVSDFPLFEAFPTLSEVARFPLMEDSTDVDPAPEFGKELGCERLLVKRDDRSHPIYGGNKVRKLEFLLADALARGAKGVLTIGGIGTNHGLATAILAQRAGLSCHLVLFDQPMTDHVRRSLELFERFGAKIHRTRNIPLTLFASYRMVWFPPTNEPLYRISGGGSSPVGCLGFVNAAFELKRQIEQGVLPCPDLIFCPVGTCGTLVGLTLGVKLAGLPTRVIGVRVVEKFIGNSLAAAFLANRTLALMRRHGARPSLKAMTLRDFTILGGFLGRCYGDPTPESKRCVEVAARHGFRLETTYTGKTIAGLQAYIQRHDLGDKTVLYWNTFNSQDLDDDDPAA